MRRCQLAMLAILTGVGMAVIGCASSGPGQPSASAPASTTAAQPPSPSYVHLGDSYAAGSGVRPLVEDSDLQCLRSQRNFGEIVAAQRKTQYPTYLDVSCAGAATKDLFGEQYPGIAPQLDALGSATKLVTMTLGGNDGGTFGSAITACSDVAAADPTGAPCRTRYGSRFADYITGTTAPAMVRGLDAIRSRAPSARVIVVGYPWLLPAARGCYPTMRIASGDVPYLRGVQATLNTVVRRAAQQTGAAFVSMAAASSGHDACAAPQTRWIEPMVGARTTITLHPNAAGQQALAAATLRVLER
ncbi:SGNH/GDSL hydrolase family protein [Gordonia sp. CPCC 205333]|uniref:SGNH/GDSL hydrolase family protein n=1 Tax=Gordonia sp. CPCC 205333 TaxID=3140790 RepID=UPI003AF397A5